MTLEEKLEAIGGCGDGNCIVHRRGGMHTNGGCRCLTNHIKAQRVVHAYKAEVKLLLEALDAQRDKVMELEVEAGAAAYLASTGTMFTWDYVVRNDPAWAERLRAASRAALAAAAKVRGGGE